MVDHDDETARFQVWNGEEWVDLEDVKFTIETDPKWDSIFSLDMNITSRDTLFFEKPIYMHGIFSIN
jgi:hypothetical protein